MRAFSLVHILADSFGAIYNIFMKTLAEYLNKARARGLLTGPQLKDWLAKAPADYQPNKILRGSKFGCTYVFLMFDKAYGLSIMAVHEIFRLG